MTPQGVGTLILLLGPLVAIVAFVIIRERRKQGSRRIPLNQIAQNVRQDAGQFFGGIVSVVGFVIWFVVIGAAIFRGTVVGGRCRKVDVAALVNDDLKGNYMKLALLVCAAALSLVPSGRGAAGGSGTILTGNGLFSALAGCPKSDTSQSYGKALNHFTHEEFENCMVATGYIMGVVDALGLTPVSVTYGQDFEIIYAYLKNHLNQRQRPSLSLIRDALAEAFPPPKGK